MRLPRRDDPEGSSSAQVKSVWTDLTDAQKYSLIAIGISIVITALLWRGIWCGTRWVTDPNDEKRGAFKKSRRLHVLWPWKMMTVLFHELYQIFHAVVGSLTCGRVVYIRVEPGEGGKTGFRRSRQPLWFLTLPAGYIGSCGVGCILLYCGFDSTYSKYATVGLCGMLLFCVFVCLATTGKIGVLHYKHLIREKLARWSGNLAEAQRQRELDAEWRDDSYEMEATISAERILLIALWLLPFYAVAWYLSDSIGLRFLIIFTGTMSAAYAVADVCIDGIIHRDQKGSDARVMAEKWHGNKKYRNPEDGIDHNGDVDEDSMSEEEKAAITRWTIIYAVIWIIIQVVAILVTVYLALSHFRTTMAEQAYESRQLWPTPNHWKAADTWAQAKSGIQDGIQQYGPGLADSF